MPRPDLKLVWLAVATVLAAACANPLAPSNPYPPTHFMALDLSLPSTMRGYDVKAEATATKQLATAGSDSLFDGGEVFSFRQGTLLVATLEVGRLVNDVNPNDPNLQDSVVNQIGSSILRPTDTSAGTVWEGTGNQERIYVWFRGRLVHILLTHDISNSDDLAADLESQP